MKPSDPIPTVREILEEIERTQTIPTVRKIIESFRLPAEWLTSQTKEKETVAQSSSASPKEKKAEVHVVDVVRTGEKIIIPATMSLSDALKSLKHQMDYEEQETAISAEMEGFLYEGAWAFFKACEAKFGWVRNVATPSWFGDRPPVMLQVPVSRTEVVPVPWGRIQLPVLEGYLQTGTAEKGNRFYFQIGGVVKRKFEKVVQELVEDTRRRIREESIYKGKAMRVRFKDEKGEELPHPEPEFMNLDHAPAPEELIFRREVFRQIETNIFTVLTHTEQVRKAGVPRKRGILLSGLYGTGKTLVAAATARMAEENGWTFLECQRADELAQVVRVGQSYGQCVVFCEDIDQVMAGERSINMNEVLNVVDGVDAKSSEVLIVLTTNHAEKINQAMIRPGRIDAVIDMLPPDAEAAERLVRMYGRGLVPVGEDLSEACDLLQGQIPSLIRECVEASKLYAISLAKPEEEWHISGQALVDATTNKQMQMALLEQKQPDKRSAEEKAAQVQKEGMELLALALTHNRQAEWAQAEGAPENRDGRLPSHRALNAAPGK